MLIYGINPVLEALRAGCVRRVRVSAGGRRAHEVVALAARAGIPINRVPAHALDQATDGGVHQGIVADVAAPASCTVEELVAAGPAPALVLVLDGIQDPHNLGAILRTVDGVGGSGVVIQHRRAAARGGTAAKASAGALAHVRSAEVVNLARALNELKSVGVWTVGLAGDGAERYDRLDLTRPTAFVLGAEGQGLRRLVRERCDLTASIPMRGHVASLNVSVAAGVVLFEALRQRGRGSRF